jgi:Flp pilus assembly protein TadG
MTRRQDKSKGQAIVLVTLSLIAMAGMIGLAVDLGWSFFVQRSAQAAADAAAFGAVQEAKTRLKGGWNGFACPAASKSTDVFCQPAAVDCSGIPGGPTNLYNGCRYAVTNGFTSGSARQKVTIQSNCGVPASGPACTLPPALGVTNAAYWVTVKTVQTVPQLFSSILGNTTGIVSAVSTAALVSTPLPGQIIALNRPGPKLWRRRLPGFRFLRRELRPIRRQHHRPGWDCDELDLQRRGRASGLRQRQLGRADRRRSQGRRQSRDGSSSIVRR